MKLSNTFLDNLASYIEANYIYTEYATAESDECVAEGSSYDYAADRLTEAKPKKKLFKSIIKVEKGLSRESAEDYEVPCDSMPQSMSQSMQGMAMAGSAAPRSLDEVVANLDKSFMELVFSFADVKGLSDVDLQKKGNIDRKAFSKLRCGTTKKPSKSTAMALAIALELNLDETKDLLSRAGYALSPCSKQDLIVRYFIENEAYDIYALNEVLADYGEAELGVRI